MYGGGNGLTPSYGFSFQSQPFFYDDDTHPQSKMYIKDRSGKKCWTVFKKTQNRHKYLSYIEDNDQ